MQNQNLNGISSSADYPQINYKDAVKQLEQSVRADAQRLMLLQQQGLVSQNQAQYIINKLIETQNQIELLKQNMPLNSAPEKQPEPVEKKQSSLDLFNEEKPDFFKQAGRCDVLDYIKNLDMDKDEISKIADMVEKIEKTAVESYLKQSAHDKTLNDENAAAKSKLTSYVQNALYNGNNNRVFTREDIGRMSGDEFAKNEKLILEQVKQGLIK
jgi:hypothetical protein